MTTSQLKHISFHLRQTRMRCFSVLMLAAVMLVGAQTAFGVWATGGSTTNIGGYRIHTFTNSATASNLVILEGGNLEVLVVAGGGGGGNALAGGGGAGGLIYSNTYWVDAGTTNVTVGLGGVGGATNAASGGSNGLNSTFGTLTAIGGGGGSGWSTVAPQVGGSGGGAYPAGTGAAGTAGQGRAGGNGGPASGKYPGGGGGGYGSVGTNGSGTISGSGGMGTNLSQFGSVGGDTNYPGEGWFAGGGGAGTYLTGGTAGNGGKGGGGKGGLSDSSNRGSEGQPNTGGGGGCGSYNGAYGGGGTGGSGIVIVRYLPTFSVSATAASGIGTTNATLNGIVNNVGGAENPYVYFCWGYTNAGTNDLTEWPNYSLQGTSWGEGQSFSTNLTGLIAGSNYVYRCFASNTMGIAWGAVQEFSTVHLPAVTNLGSVDTLFNNTLRGQITDGGGGDNSPTVWFYYWPASGGTTSTVPMGPQSGVFSNVVTGLPLHTPYQYQILASNAAGTAWSTVSNFMNPAALWYVATNGNNSAGTNWVTAYTNIQTALDSARTNDTICIAGQVLPITSQVNWTNKLAPYLTIRGGYAANTNDLALPGSNSPALWPTVIQRQANNIRILYVSGIVNGALDQVTLTGGFVEGGGGGLCFLTSTNVVVSACIISNNLAGATASGSGGGVYSENSNVTLSNCVVRGNTSRGIANSHGYGGGIYLKSGTLNCIDSQVSFNIVTAGGGSGRSNYGGIQVFGGTMLLNNCLLVGNQVSGAIGQAGNFYGNLQMVNCTVAGNIYGGIRGTTASLTNCIVWKNQDDIIGGTTLANCNISDGDSNEVNGCISADPLFEYGYYLPAGSPSVNAGTGSAADWGLGSPYTTQTDGSPDSGNADMGYHYPSGIDPVANADFYVSAASGDDAFAGTNWAAPFKTITMALAQAGDVRRIYVASGNYTNNMETFPLIILNRSSIELLGTNSASTIINAQGAVKRVFYLDSTAKAKLTGLTIQNGIAVGGGGLGIVKCGDVLISSCVVSNNAGGTSGGGLSATFSDLTVIDSVLVTNSAAGGVNASGYGGAMYLGTGNTMISNCVIRGNSSSGANSGAGGFGGGIYNASGTLNIRQSVLTLNTANKNVSDTQGGGLNNAGVATLQNCLITTNRSTAVATKGDGIYSTGTLSLQNCTVANNRGEGLRAGGTASVSNSVFWGNGVDIVGGVTLAYCNTQQGTNNVEENCISSDPLFADNTYFHEMSRAGFYTSGYFSAGSWSTNSAITNNPVIDAGASSTDWDNEPQPNGRRVNMGAYGNTPAASKTFLEEPGEFTTLAVHSYPPADVGPSSGKLSGEVLNDGGAGNPDTYILWDDRGDQGATDTGMWQQVKFMGAMPAWQLFSTNLTGIAGTIYYRCFVTNSAGSDWSELQSFGPAEPPEVTNNGAFPVYRRTAILTGTITDIGGDPPYAWFYYWINGDPVTNIAEVTGGPQSGTFSNTVANLQTGSEYQFKILASNTAGTVWSSVSDFTTVASPATWYAATNGTGLAGTNWSTAFPTLQAALNVSENNDTIYLAGQTFPISNTVTWAGMSNITIRGGFAATNNAPLPGDQDRELWPSVLQWVTGTPDHRVLSIIGITNSLLESITFKDGYLSYAVDGRFGAGIYIEGSTGLTLSACLITNNLNQGANDPQGGGIYSISSWLTLTNCVLNGNSARGTGNTTSRGGGICLISGEMLVVDSLIQSCQANGANNGNGYGGGIDVLGGSMVLRRSVLRGNSASSNRGGYYGLGGGLYNGGTIEMQNCLVVTNNSITDTGDGIYSAGTMTLVNSTIADNDKLGIVYSGGSLAVTNSIIWGHSVSNVWNYPVSGGAFANMSYTLIGGYSFMDGTNGCMTNNPLFDDSVYYHLQSKKGVYRGGYFSGGTGWENSIASSPGLDAGTNLPSIAWQNEPLPNGKLVNMGAYGGTSVASISIAPAGTIFMIR